MDEVIQPQVGIEEAQNGMVDVQVVRDQARGLWSGDGSFGPATPVVQLQRGKRAVDGERLVVGAGMAGW